MFRAVRFENKGKNQTEVMDIAYVRLLMNICLCEKIRG